ncbi:YciI family protein [Roseibium sp.]|uniref:YciI family protein n=1 Tax=Roseibium sp. TaxID=1936156 RepID=UPI003D0FC941
MPLVSASQNLFVIDLHYVAPMDKVDALLKDHRDFLEKHYSAGHFLASGPKIPRTGGVILAVAETRGAVEAIVRQDPFHAAGLAEYTVTEFEPRMSASGLKDS